MTTNEPPLIPDQRRERIVGLLRRDGVLGYRQLAAEIGVSHMTVRRDIAVLEEQGRVTATPGGARIVSRMASEPPRTEKSGTDLAEKDAMAALAAGMVTESMTLYLDAGTTLQAIRPHLQRFDDLTVVTNDLVIAASFLDHPTIDIIVVGGRIEKQNQSTVGRLPALALHELSIDIAFLTTSSWDARRGVTIPTESKVDPKRAAMQSATTSVLVAASSKYGTFGRYRVADLGELDLVVTDAALEPADLEAVRATGVEVELATTGLTSTAESTR
jgi:DeoR/GlpR family transcriptional regulator of sugar metabolism